MLKRVNDISLTLNGERVMVGAEPGERLSESLRERLGARDVKIGCNAGDCGACTVLVDGAPVCACLMTTQQAAGCAVETAAGLSRGDPHARALAERFQDHGAAQCGFCTPGMVVAAVALLRENDAPDEAQIEGALAGVLCRCTGYRAIVDAVAAVPGSLAGAGAVGDSIRRLDGADKLTGAERFGDDIAPPGTLTIRVIRSPHARAAFEFGDLERWRAGRSGIEAVLTADDIPGENRFGVIPQFADQPVFAQSIARFRGEAIAAVVGEPQAIDDLAPADFPVTWTPLDAVAEPAPAREPGAPLLHDDRADNVMCEGFVRCGDAKAALARADVVATGAFATAFVEHAYLEPEAGFAEVVDGRVEIHVCTQAPVMDLESMALILGRDKRDVRIVPSGCGGGFGSKLDLSIQPYLALGALKTGRPVRLALTRTESMQSTTKRHPASIALTIGATKDGKICGF